MRGFLSGIFFKINIVIVFCLLLAYLSVFINPVKFWFLATFGLLYPVLLLINIAFVILWIADLNKRFFISLIVIIIGWPFLSRNIQFFPHKKAVVQNTSKEIKIMSYNVRLFNLYNWVKEKKADTEIFSFIKEQSPDIVCFQEFYTRKKGFLSEKNIHTKLSALNYKHIKYTYVKKSVSNFGIATYSKYPIVGKGSINFTGTLNHCLYSDLKIGNDTIRVYNLHLQSYRFLKENYEFLDSLTFSYNTKQVKGLRSFFKRIKTAYLKRGIQADTVSSHILNSPYPVIVCGDFNDSPVSYTYQKISRGLRDVFVESGSGLGSTYLGKFPSYRIDYVLHSKEFKGTSYSIPNLNLSDHQPVVCKMVMK